MKLANAPTIELKKEELVTLEEFFSIGHEINLDSEDYFNLLRYIFLFVTFGSNDEFVTKDEKVVKIIVSD